MKKKIISIVVPLYNEKGNILPLLQQFQIYFHKYNFELILVNDGSSDGSEKILEEVERNWIYNNFIKVVSYKRNKWYWGAILEWLQYAQSDILWWMHSDLQTDISYIFQALDLYLQEAEHWIIVKWYRKNRKISQVLLSVGMSIFASLAFGFKITEINAQPKVFSRDLYTLFQNAPTDFSLDLYLLVLAYRKGYQFKTIDVNFIDRIYGESKWSFSFYSKLKTIMRTIHYIIKLRLWNKFGKK